MPSVTQFIKSIKQPRGGYLPIKDFIKTELPDDNTLEGKENIPPVLIGTLIDSFSRFLLGDTAKEAFKISLRGAAKVQKADESLALLDQIAGLNDSSIDAACKLVGFDTAFRAGPSSFEGIDHIQPDQQTINNIKVMLTRSQSFFKAYGPVIKSGVTFEGGYTANITSGDADFLTEDTLWDMKVFSSNPQANHSLQLLIYFILMNFADFPEIEKIKYIGFFNPRKNLIYRYPVDSIPHEVGQEVIKLING